VTATEPTEGADPIDGGAIDGGMTRTVAANGIEIAYEAFGDPADPAVLLVMGLGTQMLAWPDEMCEALAAAGHHVIRFDNRDVGLSTHIDTPPPSLRDMVLRRGAPYSIGDMADDAIGLCDALGVERFHVVGASMGGFIAQTIAIDHPDRVLTMTLIMTSTGSRRVGRPTPLVMRRMAAQSAPRTREEAMEETVAAYRVIGSPDHLDEDLLRDLAGRAYDRSHDPAGRQRQLAAILSQPNRTDDLRRLRIPTLVIHGLDDPLVTVSGGLALAKAIPGATFIGHHGMGHDLPRTMWSTLTDDILGLIDRGADRGAAAGAPAGRVDA
jgi:pimeloyl-ACP methyl ester carboxylesterase